MTKPDQTFATQSRSNAADSAAIARYCQDLAKYRASSKGMSISEADIEVAESTARACIREYEASGNRPPYEQCWLGGVADYQYKRLQELRPQVTTGNASSSAAPTTSDSGKTR